MNSPADTTVPPAEPVAPSKGSRLGMPAKLGLAALAVCALSALFWPRGESTFKEPGGFLYDANGRATTIGPRLAPVTLVHFWATWCPPCIQEVPALQRLSHDFAGHEDFSVLMVAVSDSNSKVQSFLGRGAGDMVLFDPNWDVANRYGTSKLPETYLVVKGQVVRKFVGMTDWDNVSLRQEIEAKLKGARATTTAVRQTGT
ncbi:MAG TPA: TlpA disulfide reductase family protein [Thermoanaerobaculia bacterium]|nr:TlpA disulfide reductase family protein [Thermoanaerobaculia bacterium]